MDNWRKWRRGAGVEALLISLPVLVLSVVCLLKVGGPIIRSDEIAYLGRAAALAGKGNQLAGSWYSGYSLLLAPFFRIAPDVIEAWPAVVAMNGVALITSGLCLWGSLQNCGVADRPRATQLMLLSLLVFGSVAFLGWALPNCLLMALVAVVVWLLSLPRFGLGHAVAIGLLVGYAASAHPVAGVLTVAAAMACVAGGHAQGRWRQGVVVLIIGLSIALTYVRVVHPWAIALQGGGPGHYATNIGSLSRRAGRVVMLPILALGILNGLAGSAIASFGFAGSALAAILPWRPWPSVSAPVGSGLRRVLIFLLSAWGGMLLLTAGLMLFNPRWLQHAFHLRYSQPVLAGLVVYGMALSPRSWPERLRVWSLSAGPILLALLIAVFINPYDKRFNFIDQLAAATFFLEPGIPTNVPLMLGTGLLTTGAVQLLGLRAFVPLAAGLSLLGWQRMDWFQRSNLQEGMRPPAMARAVSTLARDGLRACTYLANTPATRDVANSPVNERARLMRYYLSGVPIQLFRPGQPMPEPCDVLVRPVDSETTPATSIGRVALARCRPLIGDLSSNYLLEDCRPQAAVPGLSIEGELLPSRRDLISLTKVQQLRPSGDGLVGLFHPDALPPPRPRDQAWWRGSPPTALSQRVEAGSMFLHGPWMALPAGRFRAIYDGLNVSQGTIEMTVTSDNGTRILARRLLPAGSSSPALPFSLDRPQNAVEVILRAEVGSIVQMPSLLMIFGNPPDPASPWRLVAHGR